MGLELLSSDDKYCRCHHFKCKAVISGAWPATDRELLLYANSFNGGLTIVSVFLSLREPSEDEDVKEDVAEDEMV